MKEEKTGKKVEERYLELLGGSDTIVCSCGTEWRSGHPEDWEGPFPGLTYSRVVKIMVETSWCPACLPGKYAWLCIERRGGK